MQYREQEILQTLYDEWPHSLTTAEIYSRAVKKTGSELRSAPKDTVSKLLYKLRGAKPALIASSDAVGGAKHNITAAGKAALLAEIYKQEKQDEQQPMQAVALDVDHRPEPTPVRQKNTVEAIDAETDLATLADEQPAPIQETEQPQAIDGDNTASAEPLEAMANPDSAIETLARDGYTFLDPQNAIDAAMLIIKQAVIQAEQTNPALHGKAEKLAVLNLMKQHYGYINTDFETVLADIVMFLDQFEAAA